MTKLSHWHKEEFSVLKATQKVRPQEYKGWTVIANLGPYISQKVTILKRLLISPCQGCKRGNHQY